MSSKIQVYIGHKTIDRSSEPLPKGWVWIDATPFSEANRREQVLQWKLDFAEDVICLLTERIDDTKIIEALHKYSSAHGKRIYLLVGEYTASLNKLRGHCLIRTLSSSDIPRGSLLLVNPNSNQAKAYLFSDSFAASTDSLELFKSVDDEGQKKELFRYFCYLFWEKATEEYLSQEHSEGQPVKGKGVDVYFDTTLLSPTFLYDLVLQSIEGQPRSSVLKKYLSLDEGAAHLYVKQSEKKELPDVHLHTLRTKEGLEQTDPSDFVDDLRYLSIDYSWKVHPLYLPKDAIVARLYKDWDEYRSMQAKNLESLQRDINKKLEEANKARGTDRARCYLGLEVELKEIIASLDPLLKVSWGEDRASYSKLEQASGLDDRYRIACRDLENAIKRNELEQQEQELKRKIDAAQDSKEVDRYNLALKSLRGEYARLQSPDTGERSPLDDLYSHQKSKATGTTKAVTIPSLLLLPEVGKLYQQGDKFYLAIADWSDYDRAQREAIRLQATLCAMGDRVIS